MKRTFVAAVISAATALASSGQAAPVRVRYIVSDVDKAVAFYTRDLGFISTPKRDRTLPCFLAAISNSF